jgi:hypothetical protein
MFWNHPTLALLLVLLAIVGRYRRIGHHSYGKPASAILGRLYAERHAALGRHLSTSWPGTVVARHVA